MKIRHQELRIDEKNPFLNCKLDRQQYSDILTTIVKTYADGFVLAINNDWGAGKTTFVKMWQQYLNNEEIRTVYFNAWENDFDDNPIVAILAELNSLTGKSNKAAFKSVLQKGAVFTKAVLPSVTKGVTKKLVGVDLDLVADAVENATKATTEILQAEIDDYTRKKDSIKDFRKKLEDFVEKTADAKPIIFIIDELDRCRPDYAVKVLEQMKHFFSVRGIVFVLSIDKQHLAASVKGFYGSDDINTDEYLRRFIDLEYSLPDPKPEQYCRYLYDYYEFDDFFETQQRAFYVYNETRSDMRRIAQHLLQGANATLRQMEKIFGQTRLILNSFKPGLFAPVEVVFFLVYLAVVKPDLYYQLKKGKQSLQEVSDVFSDCVPVLRGNEIEMSFLLFVLAFVLVLYRNDIGDKNPLYIDAPPNKFASRISSKLDTPDGSGTELGRILARLTENSSLGNTKISYLTSKIDLTEALTF